ncbi:DegT/DnrJ/EryC1/StrS family aminotransferase [uncultured Cohaesibacter sp.]|uniref:DegT/DnrJ/EryC1/StrS family aminotransferase n=1 Tax=uncultured Cohaesibacter sp. TaxID=1002546 RepID=UPI002930232D|nr:DegT/DnrJ/EryC1/StrS family aminotransferase [uncultured Cohaesibacter sp.]
MSNLIELFSGHSANLQQGAAFAATASMASGQTEHSDSTARDLLSRHYHDGHIHFCSGWSSGLSTALMACDIKPEDEIIVPALAPVGIVQAILLAKARPVLVDVAADTLLVEQSAIANVLTERTKAVVVSHLYGQIVQTDALHEHLREEGIALIEDGSDAFCAMANHPRPVGACDIHVGCLPGYREMEGDIPAFVVTRNAEMHARLRYWSDQGDLSNRLMAAAEGPAHDAPFVDLLSELTKEQDTELANTIIAINEEQKLIDSHVGFYDEALGNLGLRSLPRPRNEGRRLCSYPVHISPEKKTVLFEKLYQAGFMVYQTYRDIGRLRAFKDSILSDSLDNSTYWSAGAFTLPTGSMLFAGEEHVLVEMIRNTLES